MDNMGKGKIGRILLFVAFFVFGIAPCLAFAESVTTTLSESNERDQIEIIEVPVEEFTEEEIRAITPEQLKKEMEAVCLSMPNVDYEACMSILSCKVFKEDCPSLNDSYRWVPMEVEKEAAKEVADSAFEHEKDFVKWLKGEGMEMSIGKVGVLASDAFMLIWLFGASYSSLFKRSSIASIPFLKGRLSGVRQSFPDFLRQLARDELSAGEARSVLSSIGGAAKLEEYLRNALAALPFLERKKAALALQKSAAQVAEIIRTQKAGAIRTLGFARGRKAEEMLKEISALEEEANVCERTEMIAGKLAAETKDGIALIVETLGAEGIISSVRQGFSSLADNAKKHIEREDIED